MTITLQKAQIRDAPLLATWFNNRNNIKYMSTVVRCKKHTQKGIEQDLRESDPSFERLFMVLLGKKLIGHAGIDDIDLHDQRAEIFFLIGDAKEQGKGYSKEILTLLLNYAFTKMHLNSLFATATIENIPSQRVLEKSGFKKIGIRRQFNYINGKFVDEVLYDMVKKEYKKMS